MTLPKWTQYAGAGVLALACLYIAFSAKSCVGQHEATAHEQAANQHHEQAVTNAAQATVHDGYADDAHREVERLRAELAKLRQSMGQNHPQPPNQPAVGVDHVEPGNVGAEPGNAGTNEQLAAVTAERDVLNDLVNAQDREIKALTIARDDWKRAYQQSAQEAIQLRSALAAKEGLARSERWKGRIEGLAVGIGVGYVGGRLWTSQW